MARIPYPAAVDPALSLLPAPLNAFRMLSHAAPLTRPAVELGLALLGTTTFPIKVRELVIMLVAHRCQCPYEWVQHTPIAIDAGATQAQIDAIAQYRLDSPAFDAAERIALLGTTELLDKHAWQDDTVEALREHYSDQLVVELTVLVGYYTMLAGLMNGLDIDIDPSGEHFTTLANHRVS